jgi:hypothetical protein
LSELFASIFACARIAAVAVALLVWGTVLFRTLDENEFHNTGETNTYEICNVREAQVENRRLASVPLGDSVHERGLALVIDIKRFETILQLIDLRDENMV